MREVQVLVWCDLCHETNEERVEAVTQVTVSAGSRPVVLDLCTVDAQEVRDTLALWDRIGTPANSIPDDVPDEVRRRTCPTCGQVCSNRTNMAAHLRRVHGDSIKNYR